ncbi:hypothetical protein D9611_009594 [Ephemerocybe angulata]|uniref:Invertebrate defensins family profile domain-containing protein n=1 Tax=Ephemerocybe angulata TaxID=980116 RepID=A0A8H5FFX5_9AGAR|nr:hypothetical protein D9611_009594 [Tulosesus angulatus]
MQLTSISSIFSIILAFAATQTVAENIMDLGDDDIHARALGLLQRDLMEDEFGNLYRRSEIEIAHCGGKTGWCFSDHGSMACKNPHCLGNHGIRCTCPP